MKERYDTELMTRLLIHAILVAQTCWAQGTTSYTDPMTNITFATFNPELEAADGFWQFGMVLPQTALTTDFYDYIGILVGEHAL